MGVVRLMAVETGIRKGEREKGERSRWDDLGVRGKNEPGRNAPAPHDVRLQA
jgi:hypothetical protein